MSKPDSTRGRGPAADLLPFAVTIAVRDRCLCLFLRRAARSQARRFDQALRPLGLTNGQFSLLTSLNRPDAADFPQVASLLAMDRTTLTANLKPLERRRLVRSLSDPTDARRRRLTLTAAGRRLLSLALPVWRQTEAAAEREIGEAAAGELRQMLARLS